jgi:hypothetical protein
MMAKPLLQPGLNLARRHIREPVPQTRTDNRER